MLIDHKAYFPGLVQRGGVCSITVQQMRAKPETSLGDSQLALNPSPVINLSAQQAVQSLPLLDVKQLQGLTMGVHGGNTREECHFAKGKTLSNDV
eukprot:78064-Amphidinium_carterae.1